MSEVLPPDHFHPEELMEALVAGEVRFILIGGLAAMPAVVSVIAGATSPEQVQANATAGEWQPSPSELAQLRG